MICFSCTKCGKSLERPENSAGAMIFCDCGQGNTVPWESTIAAPTVPPLEVVPLGDESIPVAQPARANAADDTDSYERPLRDSRDPLACFNHQDRAGKEKCGDCGEMFCGDCLVHFKGIALCGPCKNFRLRQKSRPTSVSGKAVLGVVVAMCCAPVAMCLVPLGTNDVAVVIGVVALAGQIVAVTLGAIALRETDKNPRLSGRSLAITTLLTGGLATLMTVCLLLAGLR